MGFTEVHKLDRQLRKLICGKMKKGVVRCLALDDEEMNSHVG